MTPPIFHHPPLHWNLWTVPYVLSFGRVLTVQSRVWPINATIWNYSQLGQGSSLSRCFVCLGSVVISRTREASWLSGTVRDLQVRGRRFDPQLCWICFDVVLLGKALCSHVHSPDPGVSGYLVGQCEHVHSPDPGVSGYLVGQWRLVSLNSSVRWKSGSWGCMLPGELRWLMNKQVLWPGGNCMKSGKWRFALDTRL